MTPCVQSHCCTQYVLITAVSLMTDCKVAKLSLFVFLNKNPKYYNGIPCIENTTIKTKSNWNPDLSSSISIKRVRTYTKEGKAHMGIVTVMIDIWLRKVRKKGMIALQLWAAVFVSLLRQKLRTDTYRSSSV